MEVKEMATTLQLQTFLPSVGACLAGGLSEPHAVHSFIPYQPLVSKLGRQRGFWLWHARDGQRRWTSGARGPGGELFMLPQR